MTGLVARWNRFWFEPIPSHSLSRTRLFVGLLVVMKMSGIYNLYRIQHWRLRQTSWYAECHLDGYRLPATGLDWLPAPPCSVAQYMDTGALVLGVLLALGLFTRVVGPLIALVFLESYLLSQVRYTHHVAVMTTTLVILAFAPCGDHYGLDALLRKWRKRAPPPMRPITSLRMLQIFTSGLYLSTFVAKLNAGWFDGRMMEMMGETGMLKGYSEEILTFVSHRTLGHTTLFAEGLLIFGLWLPRWRRFAIFTGVLFHTGIDLMMDVTTFGYQMMVLYGCFVDPRPGRTVVGFDSRRAAHVWLRRVCRALDWLNRLTWVDRADPRLSVRAQAEVELRGGRAILEIASLLPLTFIPSFPMTVVVGRSLSGGRT